MNCSWSNQKQQACVTCIIDDHVTRVAVPLNVFVSVEKEIVSGEELVDQGQNYILQILGIFERQALSIVKFRSNYKHFDIFIFFDTSLELL